MFRYLVIFLVLFTASCSRHIAHVVFPVKDSTNLKVEVREVVKEVPLPADSATIKALIKCDSLGNVYIEQIQQLQGERVQQNLVLKNDILEIKAKDKAKKTVESKESTEVKTEYKEKPIPYPVEKRVNFVSGWQWFQIWLGRILLILIIIINLIKRFLIKT